MEKNEFDIEFPQKIEELLDYPPNITWRGEDDERYKRIKLSLINSVNNEEDDSKLKQWSVEISEGPEYTLKMNIEYNKNKTSEDWKITNVEENKLKLDTSNIDEVALFLNEETYLKKGIYLTNRKTSSFKI